MANARDALAKNDALSAFTHLRWVLEFPSPIAADAALWREVVPLFASICGHIAGEALAANILAVADPEKPGVVDALYNAGYDLIEQRLSGIAATFLAKANALSPGEESIVTELAVALDRSGMHRHARELLEQAPAALLVNSFYCSYLLSFNTLLATDIELSRERQRALLPKEDAQRELSTRLDAMLLRAEALRGQLPLDDTDLRGWHFVMNGTVLLHRSPYGVEEMRGRYAFTQDSLSRCRAGLVALRRLTQIAELSPPAILGLPDRASRIVAEAAGEIFGLPIHEWSSRRRGVVIAYDMQTCELNDTQRTELAEQAPGQILYEHASCWTQPDLIAPDVCHYLHQVNEAPWGERLQFDPSSRQSMHAPQDTRPPNIVAREIVDAPALTPDDVVEGEDAAIAALVAAARALPEHARPVMLRSDGLRLRQRDDSPVKSNRFG